MDLRASLQLQASIKALTDVVLPAVDPDNKLAQEQTRLVIGMLGLMLQRLPLAYRYELDELSRFLKLGEDLRGVAGTAPRAADALQALYSSLERGHDVRKRARAEPQELESANFDLREKIGTLVTALCSGATAAEFKPVSQLVMDHAEQQLLRERAFVAPQGWEPGSKLPALETLIGAHAGGSA